jgi:hypothetical protein
MDCALSLVSNDLHPEDLHDLSLDLRDDLAVAGVEAEPVEEKAPRAARGDLMTIGSLALTLVTSGTAAALLNVVRAYFDRSASAPVVVELTRPDGAKLTVQAGSLRGAEFERTLLLANQFLGAPAP